MNTVQAYRAYRWALWKYFFAVTIEGKKKEKKD